MPGREHRVDHVDANVVGLREGTRGDGEVERHPRVLTHTCALEDLGVAVRGKRGQLGPAIPPDHDLVPAPPARPPKVEHLFKRRDGDRGPVTVEEGAEAFRDLVGPDAGAGDVRGTVWDAVPGDSRVRDKLPDHFWCRLVGGHPDGERPPITLGRP